MEENVTKAVHSAVAIAVALLLSPIAAHAGEYGNRCALGMASGSDVDTDCSVSEEINGKTYCFGDEDARTAFMQDVDANIEKADAHAKKSKN